MLFCTLTWWGSLANLNIDSLMIIYSKSDILIHHYWITERITMFWLVTKQNNIEETVYWINPMVHFKIFMNSHFVLKLSFVIKNNLMLFLGTFSEYIIMEELINLLKEISEGTDVRYRSHYWRNNVSVTLNWTILRNKNCLFFLLQFNNQNNGFFFSLITWWFDFYSEWKRVGSTGQ